MSPLPEPVIIVAAVMSALLPKADMCSALAHVCFTPQKQTFAVH